MSTPLLTYLSAVRERAEVATAGPWLAATKPEQDHRVFFIFPDDGSNWIPALELATVYSGGNPLAKEDATLIAHSRTDIPRLLAIIEVLRAACEGVATKRDPITEVGGALFFVECRGITREALAAANALASEQGEG